MNEALPFLHPGRVSPKWLADFAHGDSVMPVWGVAFERETEARKSGWPWREARLRVRLIAEYVLSLQR